MEEDAENLSTWGSAEARDHGCKQSPAAFKHNHNLHL